MKQFILKNIVLVAILGVTAVSSIFLIFFIWEKSQTIKESMSEIEENVDKVRAIESASKPNSVEQSEKKIKADTETLNGKTIQIYRHFGRPYRPALLKLIKNITSPFELKTELSLDPSLVAKPKPKLADDGNDDEEAAEEAVPSAPTDEEKAVFDPASNLVILSFDEDSLRAMLAELYNEVPQNSSEDSFEIPDTIQSERAQLFDKLFNRIIEAPDVVDSSRAEDFRKAAAAKFAQAFALFREEVQALTLEDVTDQVAHELFLDALGLPRLMRQSDCKNYVDFLYDKYLGSDVIPGLPSMEENSAERDRLVQDFIYGKNIKRVSRPLAEQVIPIIRNFQIKEDLFRRMNEAGISRLVSMNTGVLYGTTMDNDSDSPVLVFTYTLDITASMDAIDAFINSLHAAYKTDRVYVIKDIKLSAPYQDLIEANGIVAGHSENRSASTPRTTAVPAVDQQAIQPDDEDSDEDPEEKRAAVIVASRVQYDLTDPHNPEYGKTLLGDNPNGIKCTIVVDYLFYRADNITHQ